MITQLAEHIVESVFRVGEEVSPIATRPRRWLWLVSLEADHARHTSHPSVKRMVIQIRDGAFYCMSDSSESALLFSGQRHPTLADAEAEAMDVLRIHDAVVRLQEPECVHAYVGLPRRCFKCGAPGKY